MNTWEFGKIGVAAICYNEELLIGPWLNHLLESTAIKAICLVDCGSSDKTVDIISSYLETGRVFLRKTNWTKDFSSLRNQSFKFLKETVPDCVWATWIDIDTFFSDNPDKFFFSLNDAGPLYLYDEIRIPTIRIWDETTSIGHKEIICEHWSMVRLSFWKGFYGNLHESNNTQNGNIFRPRLIECGNVWLAHYDLPKLRAQANLQGTTINMMMGMKKFRYLTIRKMVDQLSVNDPDPDLMTPQDIERFGAVKIEEELETNMRSPFNGRHSRHIKGILV